LLVILLVSNLRLIMTCCRHISLVGDSLLFFWCVFWLLLNSNSVWCIWFGWLDVCGSFLLFVEVLNNSCKVLQVLTNDGKLLDGEFFSVVVIVEVVSFDLHKFLLLIWLLHVYRIVVETSDVFGGVYKLARLQIICQLCTLSILTKLFQIINCHQYTRKLSNFTQLFLRSFLLCILKLTFLVIQLFLFSLKFGNVVIYNGNFATHIGLILV